MYVRYHACDDPQTCSPQSPRTKKHQKNYCSTPVSRQACEEGAPLPKDIADHLTRIPRAESNTASEESRLTLTSQLHCAANARTTCINVCTASCDVLTTMTAGCMTQVPEKERFLSHPWCTKARNCPSLLLKFFLIPGPCPSKSNGVIY